MKISKKNYNTTNIIKQNKKYHQKNQSCNKETRKKNQKSHRKIVNITNKYKMKYIYYQKIKIQIKPLYPYYYIKSKRL